MFWFFFSFEIAGLCTAATFPDYNVRHYIRRRALTGFRENESVSNPDMVREALQVAMSNLGVAQRQAMVYGMYARPYKSILVRLLCFLCYLADMSVNTTPFFLNLIYFFRGKQSWTRAFLLFLFEFESEVHSQIPPSILQSVIQMMKGVSTHTSEALP